MKNKFTCLLLLMAAGWILSCSNKKQVFEDYVYQTVYFPYQSPVRTITLGEDLTVNTDLDNAHKCKIFAALGGVYRNGKNVSVAVSVDNSLSEGLLFGTGGSEIKPMPSSYYSLASDNILIPEGSVAGGVEIQLTDAFFADADAVKNTYVIPLKITGVSGADSILSDKNYTLYAIKYINPWTGFYLRRGQDIYTGTVSKTVSRHQHFVENDEVAQLVTRSLKEADFLLTLKDSQGYNLPCTLVLKFDDKGGCTISSGTSGITASGTGSFVKKGEKNSWGSTDRDALYLDYKVTTADMSIATKDTLVMRNRGVTMETFSPVAK